MIKTFFIIITLNFLLHLPCLEAAPKNALVKSGKKSGAKVKKKQYIDLEGLQVQGLIDRPQTLYILKKSETAFKENFDEYDYMKAIVDSIYKEPF